MKKANHILKLTGIVRRSKSIVYHVISRFKADKTLKPKPRTYRPPMTTKQEDWMIVKISLKDIFSVLQHLFLMHFVSKRESQSLEKLSHRLNKEKLVAWIACRKPLISKKNQKVRLDFTTEYIVRTEEQWNMVHFSDESKFNLFGSDGKRFVRCENENTYLLNAWRKLKFGEESVMVWGMISSVEVGPIVCFHSNINASV